MENIVLGLVNPAIAFLFAGVFACLWWRAGSVAHVRPLAAGFLLMGCGFLTFHFTPDPNGAASILLMHLFYSASIMMLLKGVCERAGVRYPLAFPMLIAIGFGIAMYLTSPAADHNPRMTAANFSYGLLLALGTQTLSRGSRREGFDRLLIWLFGLTAAQFFAHPFAAILGEGPMSAAEYRESLFYSVMMVNIAIWSLILAVALVAACVIDHVDAMRIDSETDHLTGLASRRAFERDAVALLDEAQGNEARISAIVADIDHFKRVNDMFGHQVGDRAIAAFGELVAKTVRADDRVGRIGGEEFCILVSNCSGRQAVRLAERIRTSFAGRKIEGLPDDLRLSASFGVAERLDGEGYGKLFARADAALYAAKDGGRDRVEGPTPGSTVTEIARPARAA